MLTPFFVSHSISFSSSLRPLLSLSVCLSPSVCLFVCLLQLLCTSVEMSELRSACVPAPTNLDSVQTHHRPCLHGPAAAAAGRGPGSRLKPNERTMLLMLEKMRTMTRGRGAIMQLRGEQIYKQRDRERDTARDERQSDRRTDNQTAWNSECWRVES